MLAQVMLTVAVADGGLSEQQALQTLAHDELPSLKLIVRDRAHRMRAVQRQTWTTLQSFCNGLLDVLVSGSDSIANTLEHSRKLMLIFEQAQSMSSDFPGVLRNFAYAAQRFDSFANPLLKLLKMWPCVYDFLAKVCSEGDGEDYTWARGVLSKLTGAGAHESIIRTAMVCDAMVTCQRFVRLCEDASDDAMLTGAQAGVPGSNLHSRQF